MEVEKKWLQPTLGKKRNLHYRKGYELIRKGGTVKHGHVVESNVMEY